MAKTKTAVLSVSLTPEERKAAKQLALDLDTTVSELFRRWLQEHMQAAGKTLDGESE